MGFFLQFTNLVSCPHSDAIRILMNTVNSRKGQRTNHKYWKLVGSDQQMQRLKETELRKADRTVRVYCFICCPKNIKIYKTVYPNRTVSLPKFTFFNNSKQCKVLY